MIERYIPPALAALAKQTVKSPEFQRELLEAARDSAQFVRFVEDAMRSGGNGEILEGDQKMDLPAAPFCEREFNDLPLDEDQQRGTIQSMAALWPDLEKRDASEPGVWARVNLRMVEDGKVKPAYFAGGQNGGKGSKGLPRIDDALAKGGKDLDGCARRIVRSFAGCPQIRGIRTLYQDCPPARAWWTHRLADEAARELARNDADRKARLDAALNILQRKAVWENLSERIVSRLTVLGDNKIRNGIILFLTDEGDSRFLKGDDLKRLFRRIGQMCAWRALGYFGSDGVSGIIRGEIVPTIPPKS